MYTNPKVQRILEIARQISTLENEMNALVDGSDSGAVKVKPVARNLNKTTFRASKPGVSRQVRFSDDENVTNRILAWFQKQPHGVGFRKGAIRQKVRFGAGDQRAVSAALKSLVENGKLYRPIKGVYVLKNGSNSNVSQQKLTDIIVQFLKKNKEPMSLSHLKAEIKTGSAISPALTNLIRLGLVERVGKGLYRAV